MKKLFTIVIAILLSLPLLAWAVDDTVADVDVVETEQTEQVANQIDEDIQLEEQEQNTQQPVSKRKIMKKFFAAMSGVVVSSILIYLLLTVYNRVREQVINRVKTPEGETSLKTPDELDAAVKIFLEKTKWD